MKLLFIRHTSLSVEPGICYGRSDIAVSPTFNAEATQVKDQLAPFAIDAVYTSPLSRCTRLAHFCGYPQATSDPRLLELNFGNWELQPWISIPNAEIQPWYDNWLHLSTPQGESFAQQIERVSHFIDQLAHSGHQTVAVFTHGGVIRAAAIYFNVITASEAFTLSVDYGSLTHFNL